MRKQVLLILLTAAAFIFANGIYAGDTESPPADIDTFFDNYTKERIKDNPEFGTRQGLSKKLGYPVERDRLNDESPEAVDRFYAKIHKYRRWLDTYDRSRMTPSQRRAADILAYALDERLVGEKFKDYDYVINHTFGFHNNLTSVMTQYHTISTRKDAEDYLARLRGYKDKIQQLSERLTLQEKKGIIPPLVIIAKMGQALSQFISTGPKDNILYSSFKTKIEALDINDNEKTNLCRQAEEFVRDIVYPSYRSFLAHLESILQNAGNDAGVWKLPEGDHYYRYCIKVHTNTAKTPEEVHKLGLAEVRRIQKEIRKLLGFTGFKYPRARSFGGYINAFWRQERGNSRGRLFHPNTPRGKEQVLKDFEAIIDEVSKKVPQLFSLVPKRPVIVRPVPAFKEQTMGTNYLPASMDGKRVGTFYINLVSPPFKPGMKTLAVHEAVPGHHFQLALQAESPDIHMFRNFHFFTAYVEGWALYAERLARENSWFADSHSKIGSLSAELFRAVRLVVDTGIHYKRWDRQKAFNYMRANLGWGSYGEIDRYIIWPGQACAYKIGELKILELRKRAKKALKKKFDIKAFHRVILENGAVPLPLLDRFLDEYIKRTR